jgi:hypothetical protein
VSLPIYPVIPVEEASVGEEPLPDIIVEDGPVTYNLIEGGTRRGYVLLADSIGFTYSKKRQTGVAVSWRCRIGKCPATVCQLVGTNDYTRGPRQHDHPNDPSKAVKSTVRVAVEEMAKKELYAPSGDIVSRAMVNIPVIELPNMNSLLRHANRVRANLRPNHPTDLNFELDM